MEACGRTVQECQRAGFGRFNEGRVIETDLGPPDETPAVKAYRSWAVQQPPGQYINPHFLIITEAP